MLSKKSIKVISIVVLAIMMLMTIGSVAFAAEIPTPNDVTVSEDISTAVGNILGIIKWAGLVVAVAIAMFIGIKYITASPEGKAEVKKTLIYYVAGIVILLSATAIVTLIQTNFTIK